MKEAVLQWKLFYYGVFCVSLTSVVLEGETVVVSDLRGQAEVEVLAVGHFVLIRSTNCLNELWSREFKSGHVKLVKIIRACI